ncbi:TIGR02647 family protein [Vibrio navarrensis]|uniref:DNA-binding protein n=1 Tax=Vibrio navarrensis TaxID=29495 RepID=A0A099LKI2_9VIBR|nr:TIGR02647 family protein [Vibrio navarrensis]ELV8625887.1 TIGR02647 family protein [Vibrio cidicii]EGR2794339.1 TIGR02647 family protein [Vibrio navarrensis]EHA1127837.1 TIGR02647 family protein [Vibrio navarrensis]EJK2116526.1 TIGR02647 family protein [Vibrio navarrensis]EJL6393825.1 TIGR02647 family protein [Vibrio navarrensis]
MKFTEEHIAELNLLLQFDLSSAATGIKVHKEASQSAQEAVKRLFDKGLCTQIDGGYLTDEGIEVAEHAERTLRVLSS